MNLLNKNPCLQLEIGVFQFGIFLVLFWVNQYVSSPSVILRVLLTLFRCCLINWIFCFVLFVAIFCSRIVLFSCHPVIGMSSCNLPLTCCLNFFRCFGMSNFVCIVLSCLDIFLAFLLSPVTSGLFRQVVLSVLNVLIFLYCAKMFQDFSSVLTFLLVVRGFFWAFPVEFPNQILNFVSVFGDPDFFHWLISLLHRLVSLLSWCFFFVEICVNNSFNFFSFCLIFLGFLTIVISSFQT